jgi:hypothetical protein
MSVLDGLPTDAEGTLWLMTALQLVAQRLGYLKDRALAAADRLAEKLTRAMDDLLNSAPMHSAYVPDTRVQGVRLVQAVVTTRFRRGVSSGLAYLHYSSSHD